jgi:MFS family permease
VSVAASSATGAGLSTRRLLDIAVACNFLAIGIMLAAVPRYVREELGGSRTAVGTAATIFFAAALLTRPFIGRLMDRVGRRPFLIWPLLVMAPLALSMNVAHTVWAVIVIRFLQGVFGSSFYTACAVVATDLAPADQRASALARLSLMIYLGFAFGPFIGEFLFDRGTQWPWLAAVVLHLLGLIVATRLPETLIRVGGGEVPHPTLRRMRRVVLRPGVAQMCAGLGYACVVAFLPSYSRSIGIGSSGALFFTYACSALVVRVVSGRLADHFGYVAVAIPGMAVFAGGLFLMAIAWNTWVPFPAIVMVGIGFGAVFPALTAVAVARAPDEQRGAVLGVFLSFNDLGNAIAGPAVGAIADAAGFRWGYGVPAIVAAAGVLVTLSLRPRGLAVADATV